MQSCCVHDRVLRYASLDIDSCFNELECSPSGLLSEQVHEHRNRYGSNEDSLHNSDSLFIRFRRAFVNPFSVVLCFIACISFFTDVVFSSSENHNVMTVSIVIVMLLLSGGIRFVQELRAKRVSDNLLKLVTVTCLVRRDNAWVQIDACDLVVGDFVKVTAGSTVPADIRITSAQNCLISQSAISGESVVVLKDTLPLKSTPEALGAYSNIAFKGTTVMSGSMTGVVLCVGNDTVYGNVDVRAKDTKKTFNKGANSIAWVLIAYMVALVPLVFVVSGVTHGSWVSSLLFSLSIAVGLTPELLPMVITACLARGSSLMSKKQTVVKDINAMQTFGSMDVLCTDKTGTLTQDELILEYYLDVLGNEDKKILDCLYINSYFNSGADNKIDQAILHAIGSHPDVEHFANIIGNCRYISDITFDYDRRIASVIFERDGHRYIISKGELSAILSHSNRVMYDNKVIPMGLNPQESMHFVVDEMLQDGMKVLAIAVNEITSEMAENTYENNLILMGYVGFFDAPKNSAKDALQALDTAQVMVKVLTGDNEQSTLSICRRLGIRNDRVITGEELEKLNDDRLHIEVEQHDVFTQLSPSLKSRIVQVLQENGHTVGYLGDGINDLPAIMQADVGISVDNALPTIKEASHVILLRKDLHVVCEGIEEGRHSFANMLKYIKITASSNLGNIIAIVFASVLLPFFPMTSVQILLLNLLYDTLCLALPWDEVDDEMINRPLDWSGHTLSRFMMSFGPLSSIFDLVMFAFLFFILCPVMAGGSFSSLSDADQVYFIAIFQTGWFLESMWTQVLILHLLRTRTLHFWRQRPSMVVVGVTIAGIICFTLLAMLPPGRLIGLTQLPVSYFVFLSCLVLLYLVVVSIAKYWYIKKYGQLV